MSGKYCLITVTSQTATIQAVGETELEEGKFMKIIVTEYV
jgi:hypothetical protein